MTFADAFEAATRCPWCKQPPQLFDCARGTTVECDRDECPAPDDAAIRVGWGYLWDDMAAITRWNEAAATDAAKIGQELADKITANTLAVLPPFPVGD